MLEEVVGILRFHAADAEGERPAYCASGTAIRWARGVGTIEGLSGTLTHLHWRALARLLLDRGFRILYLDRPDGPHTVPGAVRVEGGDFAGMWRLDLVDVRLPTCDRMAKHE